jgi:long-subunit fatty acid transport protein
MGGASIFPDNCLYSANSNMSGQSYYYGYTLGAAYKINDHWSVYGGARLLYGTTKYYGYVNNIRIVTPQGQDLGAWMRQNAQNPYVQGVLSHLFNDPAEAIQDNKVSGLLTASTALVDDMLKEGISLNCTQDGYGVAPIIGVDFKTGNFNFAAKYEFKTRMRLENKANNSSLAKLIPSLDRFADGIKEAEDVPALLTLGAQWSIIPTVRVSAGWHHFFDKDARMHQDVNRHLDGDTNEYLFGAEWDVSKRFTVSAGGQRTVYGLSDEFMDDISFSVSSTSFGLGCSVKLSQSVKINLAYFWTNYQTYDRSQADYNNDKGQLTNLLGTVGAALQSDVAKGAMTVAEINPVVLGQAVNGMSQQLLRQNTAGADSFTRTNHVIGIGADFTF